MNFSFNFHLLVTVLTLTYRRHNVPTMFIHTVQFIWKVSKITAVVLFNEFIMTLYAYSTIVWFPSDNMNIKKWNNKPNILSKQTLNVEWSMHRWECFYEATICLYLFHLDLEIQYPTWCVKMIECPSFHVATIAIFWENSVFLP